MIIPTTAKTWVPVVAWTQVTVGLAGLLALLTSPAAAVIVGTAAALVALTCRALAGATHKLDRILAEELDR
ncbi:hypothetical protein ALI22I_37675 [Saccharothrix sp. ALI-22-I]|uniref:hypothetical protein n=1 Tax=Saccharothrix sp. ALI-22-I TaxID=1933778 RepID=UPI00097C8EF9|nr:hypothetical protein [Saccharothrix sp. ALI-22-I]ONI81919.1 hypothetical protein ALI22I_37675 [Saccharothrix sp. ALI-22-I]